MAGLQASHQLQQPARRALTHQACLQQAAQCLQLPALAQHSAVKEACCHACVLLLLEASANNLALLIF